MESRDKNFPLTKGKSKTKLILYPHKTDSFKDIPYSSYTYSIPFHTYSIKVIKDDI